MAALVVGQVGRRLAELPADQTRVFAVRLVSLLVSVQRLFEGETPATLRAREGPLPGVDPPVGFKQRQKPEGFLTVRTAEASFFICYNLTGGLLLCSLLRLGDTLILEVLAYRRLH